MRDHFTTTHAKEKYIVPTANLTPNNKFQTDSELLGLSNLRFRGVPYYALPERRRTFYRCAKRGMDISVSIAIIIAALPIIAAIVILIKATSRGPVIFRHRRIGRHGVEFDCYKFRTMVADAEQQLQNNSELRRQFQEKFKLDNDPRITRIGGFLRRTSLDELPQLIQVLQGKMTLIGPRPIVRGEIEKYSIYAEKLFSVKPGLSGLWQTSGRSNTTYRERVFLDMRYIDNRCLALDLQLLVLTVATVLKKYGAC